MDGFVLHFPYILVVLTLMLYAIEKIFMKMRKGNVTQNKFFALLVDFNILESTEESAGKEKLLAGDELESRRDLIDMRQRLEDSSSYFYSYLFIQVE